MSVFDFFKSLFGLDKREAQRKRKATRQLMGIGQLTGHGVKTPDGELAFYLISPDNLSVLSPEGIRNRVSAFTTLLKKETSVEMLALDSRQSFRQNKLYYQQRLEEETVPAIRDLLLKDMAQLDALQSDSASSREFALVFRFDGKTAVDEGSLRLMEKNLKDNGIQARLADGQDVRRILAVYYRRDVTTEIFRDFDGEEYVSGYGKEKTAEEETGAG